MAALITLALAGCGPKEPPPYQTYFKQREPYVPQTGSRNAFDTYLLAARETDSALSAKDRGRNETPDFKKKVVDTLRPTLDSVERASRELCRFEFRPTNPSSQRPEREAWFWIGKGMAWRSSELFEAGSTDDALDCALAAARFGCDLTQGDVEDVTVGVSVVGLVRAVVRANQEKLTPGQLDKLFAGVSAALARCGDPDTVIDNEEQEMLAAVQEVQDCYRDKKTDQLDKILYKDGRDAVEYLQDLRDSDRPAYFSGFAGEAVSTARFAKEQAKKPPKERAEFKLPESGRPWKRFARHFFSPVLTYIDARDRFLTSVRLWAVDAKCRAGSLRGGAPTGIDAMGQVAVDPYSGKSFVYYAAGSDYRVYSVGKDGRDDGGHSDDGYQPDMTTAAGP